MQAFARARDGAVQLQFLEYFLEQDLVVAANAEGAGDFALADLVGLGGACFFGRLALAGDEGDDVFATREGFCGIFQHENNIGTAKARRHPAKAARQKVNENNATRRDDFCSCYVPRETIRRRSLAAFRRFAL